MAIRQDYVTHTWDLWVNSAPVLTGLGNAYMTASSFEKFECQAGEGGPMWLDYFSASGYYLGDGARLGFGQSLDVYGPDGRTGVYVYDFASGVDDWQESFDPNYQVPYALPYHSWVGLYLYDYTANAWHHALYPYRQDW